MKLGIITFHRAKNYGAVLQAYALNKATQTLEKQKEKSRETPTEAPSSTQPPLKRTAST